MAPFDRKHDQRPPGPRYPNNKQRGDRYPSPHYNHHAVNRRRNNSSAWRGMTRNNVKNIARRTQDQYYPNRCSEYRSRNVQYDHTRNSIAQKSTNSQNRKVLVTLMVKPLQGENTPYSRSNLENQRDSSSDYKRRKTHTNSYRVTNRQDNSLSSNNQRVDTSNITENISSKKYKIPKKYDNVPSVSKLTEDNHVNDAPESLSNNKNTKRVTDQNDASSQKTDQIKQFKILLCEMSSKIKEGWKLDVSEPAAEKLGNGEINFTKEKGQKKLYFLSQVKYISTSTTSSKDIKLNYSTFSRSNIQKYFERYLNFCNNRPSDCLVEFEVLCNIKLKAATFEYQGIDIVPLRPNTCRLKIQESSKKDIEKHRLYKTFLSCCTLPKLADLIADSMKNNSAHFNTLLLKKYFLAFIEEKIFVKREEKDKFIMNFHRDFIRGNDLSESAKELRRLLSKHTDITEEMEFTVSNVRYKKHEKDPIEPLPVERCDMFQKFFEIFSFRIVDNNIDEMVKNTIGEKFIAVDNDLYHNAIQVGLHKILDLGDFNSQLFKFLEREIHKCKVIERLQGEPNFRQEIIEFENVGLQKIDQYLKTENKKVIFCSTQHMTITEHKLRQLSSQNFGFKENQESLFISDNVLLEFAEDVKQGFLSYSLKLLVVMLQEKSTATSKQLLDILKDIFKTSHSHEDKSVIVVLRSKSKTLSQLLRRQFPSIPIVRDDIKLSPLMLRSLNALKQTNVVLRKHEMTVAELMDDEAIEKLIESPEILEQILAKKLVFEDLLTKPNGFDQKYYEAKLRNESNQICEMSDIVECNSQVTIISGESGIGKSVFLYELAQKICSGYLSAIQRDANFWLIQINLNKLPFEKLISQDTIPNLEPLFRYLDLNEVQKKIFIMSAERGLNLKLILVIDGYDELHTGYKHFVLEILQQCENSSIENIFIASRDNTIFESAIGVSRYTIEFPDENKKQYCCKYLARNPDYIDGLAKELTSTPLKLKMLNEINSNHQQYVPINDLFDLYEKYVELKIDRNRMDIFIEASLQRVLSKEDFRLVNFEFQEKNLDFIFPEDLQYVTFYEYFTSWWLMAKFINEEGDEEGIRRKISYIIDRLVGQTSPVFLSVFLATLTPEETINEIAEYGCLNLLKVLLGSTDMQNLNLHRVIQNNSTNAYKVLKYLAEHYKRTNETNDCQLVEYVNKQSIISGETPIQLSCRLGEMDLACELMLMGADVICLNSDFLFNLVIHMIRELIGGNSRFENIAEKLLLKLSSEALARVSQESEFPKLIQYLLERGRKTLVERLLMKEPNRKKLLTMRVDGESLLDLVNNSQWLDDAQRLKMFKYIIDNAGDELEREYKFFIEPVLCGACKTGCERIFNYFVDWYPKNINGFLDKALGDNRLSDIKFVVSISRRKRTIDENGNTLLHRAIRLGTNGDITDFLIAREGLNEVNRNKETAMHVAFKTGQKFSRIKYLIERGASLLTTDKYGLYPWCYALLDTYCRYDEEELTELIDYLIIYKKIELPKNATFGSKSDAYKKEVTRKLERFRNSQSYMQDK